MVTFTGFLFIYVLGGLTFIPLILGAILCHAIFILPQRTASESVTDDSGSSPSKTKTKRSDFSDLDIANLPDELKIRTHEPDVASGYFAVCREFVPGGVNGKPPERTTPAGAVIAAESPSVYQSMYRSIFDRNKNPVPSIEGSKVKRARNVFYVVLRYGGLH